MAKHSVKHASQRSIVATCATFVMLATTGYLFAANLRIGRTAPLTSDIGQLIEQRVEHVDTLHKDLDSLSSKIDSVSKLIGAESSDDQSVTAATTMLPKIHGPGLSVTLDDSPLASTVGTVSGSQFNINDYVIHQQDIEAVVNALWHGGAEAMMIQDQRVLSNSAIICKGNILMLQGKKYSPPYTITAIGSVSTMKKALNESKAIKEYRSYVRAVGLGWDVQELDDVTFNETPGVLQPLEYAKIMPESAPQTATADPQKDLAQE